MEYFWRGKCWERQQHPPLCAPLAAGVRDEGGWRVWGTQRRRRDEGRMEGLGSGSAQQHQDPRGSQPSTGHRAIPPCSSPTQGLGQLPPGPSPAPGRKASEVQSKPEPRGASGNSRAAAKAGTETLQDKVKKVTLRKLKSNNVLPPKSTGGALALGPKAGTEKWRGRSGGSARALPSHPPGTGSGLKET